MSTLATSILSLVLPLLGLYRALAAAHSQASSTQGAGECCSHARNAIDGAMLTCCSVSLQFMSSMPGGGGAKKVQDPILIF